LFGSFLQNTINYIKFNNNDEGNTNNEWSIPIFIFCFNVSIMLK
jgi:hypothetical protein